MRMHSYTPLALLGLLLPCGACDGTTDSGASTAIATPELVDLDALNDRLVPRGQEQALLVNFWATW